MHITLLHIMHHISMLGIFINKIKVKENLRDDKKDWLVFVLILCSVQSFALLG